MFPARLMLLFGCLMWGGLAAWAVPKLPLPQQASEIRSDAVIQFSRGMLLCDAYTTAGREQVEFLLRSGAVVSASWQLTVERQRDWWPDEEILSVELIRQVTPDMLTGHWQLLDVNTGKSHDTSNVLEAVAFLMRLRQEPVAALDDLRSAVKEVEGKPVFVLHVRAHMHDGKLFTSKWTYPLRLGKTVKILTFQLP